VCDSKRVNRTYQRREQVNNDKGLNVVVAIDMAYQSGVNEERERIIKLLEELIENRTEVNLRGAIALIKGENK
jgi:hypothetical protein